MKKIYAICLGTLLALSLNGNLLAAQTTYKWVDKDGHTHYTQKPPSDGSYERMKVQTGPSPSTSGPSYTTPDSDSNKSADEIVQQTEAKGEEMRQKNCEQAKKALETYTAFRKVRDKSGNVRILGDDERAKRIEDAKAAIKEFCQ